MFFHLMSSGKMFSAYLSDINVELFTAYRAVKDNVNEVIRLLQNRLIVLNKTCFNGLYRVNGKGEFNVPPGKYKNPLICDSSNLENVSHALARATILTDDYRNVTQNAQKGDFIYLDQPYQVKLIIHDIQVL